MSIHVILERLHVEPPCADTTEAARQAFAEKPTEFALVVTERFEAWREGPAPLLRRTWKNCIANQSVQPLRYEKPRVVGEVRDIIADARAKKLHVRAAGAGHSFSDVVHTTGILVDTTALVAKDAIVWKRPGRQPGTAIVHVGAGTRISDLNDALEREGLALENMGGYAGQTIMGAIATSTHGSGKTLGPLSSQVASIILAAGDGRVYQIEPSDGPTDPQAFVRGEPADELRKDDKLFDACVVNVGCMGIVTSLTLRVVTKYCLKETRRRALWSDVKQRILDGSALVPRHYEVLANPHATQDGDHLCLETVRVPSPEPEKEPVAPKVRHFLTGLVAGSRLAADVLVWFLARCPQFTPHLVDGALELLELGDDGYTDASFKVFDLGPANDLPACATEIAVPLEQAVPAIEAIFKLAEDAAAVGNVYLSSPIGVRFCAPSSQHLSMMQAPTCTIEVPMLVGTVGGLEMLERIEEALRAFGGRPHWGQIHHVAGADGWLGKAYPRLAEFRAARAQLDPEGIFANAFTTRCAF